MSQDNRNKTMFGRSPFFVDDDGAKVPPAAAPAAPVAPAAPTAATELGFDEDGWDFDEPSITGSQTAAAAASSPAALDQAPSSAAPAFGSGSYTEAAGGAMPPVQPAFDDALSGVPMGQRSPEPESERAFAGTMRFRAEDLAGLAVGAASSPESGETERPFSGTMRLSRHEMDAALAAVSAPVPSAPVEEAPRALGGTMRFRPEDMEDVLQARSERSAGSRATVEASPELAESLRAQTLSDLPAQADASTSEAGGESVPAEVSPVSEPDAAAGAEVAAADDASAAAAAASSGSAGGATEAPVPEPGRPVWGTIPIMIDDIPRLFAAREAEAAGEANGATTPDESPEAALEAAPPVAADGLPTEFTATIAMGTQDVLNALAKATAASAGNTPSAASAPAEAAASRAPLPPRVEGETAGLLRDLAPAAKAATPPAVAQKTGPPVVAIALGVIVLSIVAVVLYLFVL